MFAMTCVLLLIVAGFSIVLALWFRSERELARALKQVDQLNRLVCAIDQLTAATVASHDLHTRRAIRAA